jgi:hypothetical protein
MRLVPYAAQDVAGPTRRVGGAGHEFDTGGIIQGGDDDRRRSPQIAAKHSNQISVAHGEKA